MKFFILILCLLLPFLLSYLFKHNNLEWYYILIIIITFGILVASYLVKNNEQNQYSSFSHNQHNKHGVFIKFNITTPGHYNLEVSQKDKRHLPISE